MDDSSPRESSGRFLVGVQYALPDYRLREMDGTFPSFQHPSGVRVQVGRTPNGSPSALTESDQIDLEVLDLLRLDAADGLGQIGIERVWSFSRGVRETHRRAAEDVTRAIRWVTRRDEGGAAVLERQNARWSEDGSTWQRLRVGDPPLADTGWGVFDFDRSWQGFVSSVVLAGGGEPLAHEMLQEAYSLLDSNPRSCLVIAVAALEVGIKQHIERMGGTVDHGVTGEPALTLLNRDVKGLRRDRWKKLRPWLNVRLQAGVAARNKLVHEGKPPPSREDLRLLLRGKIGRAHV